MTDAEIITRDQLRSIVERIEHLEEDIKALNDDKKEIYGEAKANGYDVAIIKKVVSLAEEDAILELYLHALGMLPEEEPRARAHVRDAA